MTLNILFTWPVTFHLDISLLSIYHDICTVQHALSPFVQFQLDQIDPSQGWWRLAAFQFHIQSQTAWNINVGGTNLLPLGFSFSFIRPHQKKVGVLCQPYFVQIIGFSRIWFVLEKNKIQWNRRPWPPHEQLTTCRWRLVDLLEHLDVTSRCWMVLIYRTQWLDIPL